MQKSTVCRRIYCLFLYEECIKNKTKIFQQMFKLIKINVQFFKYKNWLLKTEIHINNYYPYLNPTFTNQSKYENDGKEYQVQLEVTSYPELIFQQFSLFSFKLFQIVGQGYRDGYTEAMNRSYDLSINIRNRKHPAVITRLT